MKVKKIKLITEEARKISNTIFTNSTQDQFPYVESAINTLDNNFNWWKDNWTELEQLIAQYIEKTSKGQEVKVNSRFTVFHGTDEKVKDVIWNGPCISYTLSGAGEEVTKAVKSLFGGIYKGKKIFTYGEEIIFLFG